MGAAPGTVLAFGEVLLRLSPPGYIRLTQAQTVELNVGGAEANVVLSLGQWHVPVRMLSALPDNPLGEMARQTLRRHRVDDSAAIAVPDSRIGLYWYEHGQVTRGGHVVYDRAGSAFSQVQLAQLPLADAFADVTWLHWCGISPAVSATAAQATAAVVAAARAHGCVISADLNYRKLLWQYGQRPQLVMPPLLEACDILVADLTSAELMLDFRPRVPLDPDAPAAAYQDLSAQLRHRFPRLHTVLFTHRLRHQGQHSLTGFASTPEGFLTGPRFEVTHVADRIGAGDAFWAGYIYRSRQGAATADALAFGLAALAWKHTVPGDMNVASPAELEALLAGQQGRIHR